jgi:carbamoyltransferase
MNILGITHCLSVNSSAALLIDGEIVSINEEERFVRVKRAESENEGGLFPEKAIAECLNHANLKPQDVDLICVGGLAHGARNLMNWIGKGRVLNQQLSGEGFYNTTGIPDYNSFSTEEYSLNMENRTKSGLKNMGLGEVRLEFYNHHLSHAASSFFCSGYSYSNIFSLDGAGDTCSGWIGFSQQAFSDPYSIEASTCQQRRMLQANKDWAGSRSRNQIIRYDFSWGWLWTKISRLLGFQYHGGEGKTMGLAPYGEFDPDILPSFFNHDGTPDIWAYKEHFVSRFGLVLSSHLDLEFGSDEEKLDPLSKEGKNLAYTVQKYYNDFLTNQAKAMIDNNGCKDFCLAGGVALNCTGNGHLSKLDFVNNVFVQPASGDNGTALGAAILGLLHTGNSSLKHVGNDGYGICHEHARVNFNHAYWGSYYTDDEIEKALESSVLEYEKVNNAPERVAELLCQDKVVCNFQGRAEIGPRALGNRSILANPCKKETLDKVNKIKGREPWRPLAPSILEEDYFKVVISKQYSPYMLMACQVAHEWRKKIPAVVHVDGSCRPQTVFKSTNPFYHDIILKFKERTGVPLVLNTSYNMYHEPIVNSPDDAIKSFVELGADALCIGNFIAKNKN